MSAAAAPQEQERENGKEKNHSLLLFRSCAASGDGKLKAPKEEEWP